MYTKHAKPVYLKIRRMVKVSEEVDELFQELFVRIWERREQIDIQQPFSAYLYRIAENMVYDFYRKAARTEKLRDTLRMTSQESYDQIEQTLFKKEAITLLHEAIATMPPLRRQAFILCKIEEKSYEEAADIMGISTNTVRNHIVKSMHTLKSYFQDQKNSDSAILLFLILSCY
nr:sigma-70 family RNA polymerase sigma factor [Sphingobacterium faecale]